MARLRIPERYRPGLSAIARLQDAAVEAIVSVLQDAPPRAFSRAVAAALVDRLPGVSPAEIQDVARTLVSLYRLASDADSSVTDLVDQIAEAMDASPEPDLRLSEEDRVRFKRVLASLLSVEGFQLRTKEYDLSLEFEHSFCTARVLTDIRPVFGSDPAQPPREAFVVHTLKISYHEGEQLKHVFIAMDDRDMGVLQSALERAESKARSLYAVLDAAAIPHPEGKGTC